jgi:hypothetical protein
MASEMPMGIEHARRSFFLEDEMADLESAFVRDGWRGAVLYRDSYAWHAMPRLIWDALGEAAGDSRWWICGYGEMGKPEPAPVLFSFDWDTFPALPNHPAHESSEWVAYNEAQTIAILAEFDVTIIGAAYQCADQIDSILSASNTSLRKLTQDEFPSPGRLEGFIKAVTR